MATEKVKVIKIDTNPATTSVKELRNELKELKSTLLSVEEGTDEYNSALQRASNIQHTLKEQMEEINANAMDFGEITSNCTKAVGGMIAGFQAATAVMNLFGTENEDVIKAMQKMQSLMALTQAISGIDDGIKAFKRLSLAIKGATASANGLKVALASTGIGALVIGVSALISYLITLKEKTDEAAEAQKKLIEEENKKNLAEYNSELQRQISLIEKLANIRGKQGSEAQTEILNFYTQQKDVIEEYRKALSDSLALGEKAANEYKLAGGLLKGTKEKISENTKALENAEDKYEETFGTKPVKDLKALQGQIDELNVKIKETEKAIEDNKIIEGVQREVDEEKKAAEQAKKSEKERQEALAKSIAEIEKIKNAYKQLQTIINQYGMTDEEVELDNLATKESENLIVLENVYAKGLIDEETYLSNRQTLIDSYSAQALEIEQKYADKRQQAIEDANRQRVESELYNIELLYSKVDLKLAEEQAALSEKLKNGEITEDEYSNGLNDLDTQALQSRITMLQQELEIEGLTDAEIIRLRTDLANTQIQLNERAAESARKAAEDSKRQWSNAISAASAFGGAASQTLDAVADMMEEGSKEQKAIQTTSAIISTLTGMMQAIQGGNAMAAQLGLAAPVGWALGALQASATLATGIATIRQINSANSGNLSGGSVSAPSSGAVSNIIAPVQYTQDIQGASIEESIKQQKVYVVESDISDTQNKVKVTQNESEF